MSIRRGFTLVELLVVVMIMAILSAIAVPKYMVHIAKTKDQTERIKLMLVRDAIERYTVEHDRELPVVATEEEFKTALAPYLGGEFPELDIAGLNDDENFDADGVVIESTPNKIVADTVPVTGWKYNADTGEFIINNNSQTSLDPDVIYSEW